MPPIVDRVTGDLIPPEDQNYVKDYIEDGTYRVNTLKLDVGGTEVISTARELRNVSGDVKQFDVSAGNRLLGRATAAGKVQELELGSGLSIVGSTISAAGGAGVTYTEGTVAPSSPSVGDLWMDTT
jgi:hypothetical protein